MASPPERSLTDWPAVLVGIACGVLAAACIGKMPPALGHLQHDLGIDLRQVGWVVSLFSTMAAVSSAVLGLAGGRIGAWRFTVFGLFALAAGGLLGAMADSYTAILVSRFVEGIGQIAILVSVPTLLIASSAHRQTRFVMGLWATYMPLGVGIALLAAPQFLAGGHWRTLWAAIAAATLLCGVRVWTWKRRYPAPPDNAAGIDWRELTGALRRPTLWLLAASFGLYSTQFFTVMTFLPTWAVQQRGMALSTASALTACMVFVNAAGVFTASSFLQKGLRPAHLIMLAHAAVGVSAFAIFAESLPDVARYTACLTLNFCGGMLPAASLASAARLATSPRQVASTQGLLLQGSNTGQFVAAPLVTYLVTSGAGATDWSRVLPMMAICAVLGLLFAASLRGRSL